MSNKRPDTLTEYSVYVDGIGPVVYMMVDVDVVVGGPLDEPRVFDDWPKADSVAKRLSVEYQNLGAPHDVVVRERRVTVKREPWVTATDPLTAISGHDGIYINPLAPVRHVDHPTPTHARTVQDLLNDGWVRTGAYRDVD